MTDTFELVVFDWDGTLMDSTAHIAQAIQRGCADLGLPVPDNDAARQVIGLSLQRALDTVCPGLDASGYQALVDAYRKHFFLGDQTITLFDGVTDTLRALREQGMTLAIATGKSRRGLVRALEATGLAHCFATTRTQDDCPSKPHPAMLLEIMEELCIDPSRTLMVGDTTHDLLMAREARTHAAGLCQGAHPREALASCEPLGLFNDFIAFSRWLLPQRSMVAER